MTGRDRQRPPSLADADWLTRPETAVVLGVLERAGHGARVVGGAVRNALIGRPVKDIDIATTALPDDVMRIAVAAGLKAVPTGIEHGTVTVVAQHMPFEVTTLRRDIETFGRHARVTYTTNWSEDASRRDFTINALYCDKTGTIHDPLGGLADIADKRVRFIGDAHERIREDYLRILRFFRFTAEYANGEPDAAGLAASAELKDGLDQLSGERIRQEILRLLTAPHATAAIASMSQTGILRHVLPTDTHLVPFFRVTEIEGLHADGPDALRRLSALAVAAPSDAAALRNRLKLSNREYERIVLMTMPSRVTASAPGEAEAKVFLYRHGAEAFIDHAILAWARGDANLHDPAEAALVRLARTWPVPSLPVRGSDVLAFGIPPGPRVGEIVSAFEDWWIKSGFPGDPALCAAELQRLAVVTKS